MFENDSERKKAMTVARKAALVALKRMHKADYRKLLDLEYARRGIVLMPLGRRSKIDVLLARQIADMQDQIKALEERLAA